jgi:hypothetical protein
VLQSHTRVHFPIPHELRFRIASALQAQDPNIPCSDTHFAATCYKCVLSLGPTSSQPNFHVAFDCLPCLITLSIEQVDWERHLGAALCAALTTYPPQALRFVSLNACNLDASAAASAAQALSMVPCLENLYLNSNGIGLVGLESVIGHLANHQSLSVITVRHNKLAFQVPAPMAPFHPRSLRLTELRRGRRQHVPDAWLRARFVSRHLRLTLETYIGAVTLARAGPRLLGLNGVPPWFLAPLLVAVVTHSHIDRYCWLLEGSPALRSLAPHFAAFAAAAAMCLAIVSSTMRDPTWDDGSAIGRSHSLSFAERNARLAGLVAFVTVGCTAAAEQVAVLVRLRRASTPWALLQSTAAVIRGIHPYVDYGPLVGVVPAVVAWLVVGDQLVVARRELLGFIERSGSALGVAVHGLLPVHSWIVHAVWGLTLVQLCVMGLPLACTVLRAVVDFMLVACSRLMALRAAPQDSKDDPVSLKVDVTNNSLNDMAVLRVMHALAATAPSRKIVGLCIADNPLHLAKAQLHRQHAQRQAANAWQSAPETQEADTGEGSSTSVPSPPSKLMTESHAVVPAPGAGASLRSAQLREGDNGASAHAPGSLASRNSSVADAGAIGPPLTTSASQLPEPHCRSACGRNAPRSHSPTLQDMRSSSSSSSSSSLQDVEQEGAEGRGAEGVGLRSGSPRAALSTLRTLGGKNIGNASGGYHTSNSGSLPGKDRVRGSTPESAAVFAGYVGPAEVESLAAVGHESRQGVAFGHLEVRPQMRALNDAGTELLRSCNGGACSAVGGLKVSAGTADGSSRSSEKAGGLHGECKGGDTSDHFLIQRDASGGRGRALRRDSHCDENPVEQAAASSLSDDRLLSTASNNCGGGQAGQRRGEGGHKSLLQLHRPEQVVLVWNHKRWSVNRWRGLLPGAPVVTQLPLQVLPVWRTEEEEVELVEEAGAALQARLLVTASNLEALRICLRGLAGPPSGCILSGLCHENVSTQVAK